MSYYISMLVYQQSRLTNQQTDFTAVLLIKSQVATALQFRLVFNCNVQSEEKLLLADTREMQGDGVDQF